jgi:phosphoglycerate kinase
MPVKYINEINVDGKKVFIRADFNVPLDEHQNITDDNRIRATIPTLQYVLDNGGAVIAASHLGRPKGKTVKEMSLNPVAKRLGELLGRKVLFADNCIGLEASNKASCLRAGEILLLENLRFHTEETANDEHFAEKLADSSDIYINDAFAVSHRAHASVEAITRFVPVCGAGFLMKKEITNYESAMQNPKRPLVAIIGGAKVSGKLEVLQNILRKVDFLLVGGGMAFTFLKAQGKETGNSLIENDLVATAEKVLSDAEAADVKLLLPSDCVIARDLKSGVETKIVPTSNIPEGWMGLDIGPETIQTFGDVISKAETIVWNGPMGVFEIKEFSSGTFAVAELIAKTSAMSIVGGGDSVAALNQSGMQDQVSFVSTAGGAFMEMMEGKTLPAIAALDH